MPNLTRAVAALLLSAAATSAIAAGTPANTAINNTASAAYTDASGPQTATSNTVSVVVDELLDVAIADGGNETVFTPDTNQPLPFTVTNTGNGTEAFELVATNLGADAFDAANVRIFLDDGDGLFDAGDTLYVFGGNEPVLAADVSRVAFVVSDIPAGLSNGNTGAVSLRATAVTAGPAGNPAGTTFGGSGDGGTDAVAGASTASVVDSSSYVVATVNTALTKAQSVLDPFGGSTPVPGATITYTLTFTLTGSGSITAAQITDPIPANTTYFGGSLTLNGSGLSDGADGDAGRFTGTGIEVNLPSPLAAPSTQAVTFQVTID